MIWKLLAATKINPDKVNVPTVSADSVIEGVLTTAYFMAGIVCVIVIIGAGIMYTTSNGEPEKTKRARYMIMYAATGLVFIMMAFVITNFIIGRF